MTSMDFFRKSPEGAHLGSDCQHGLVDPYPPNERYSSNLLPPFYPPLGHILLVKLKLHHCIG
jgi:hypothetical protein